MTDNEIVKVLCCCIKEKTCDKCPLNDGERSVSECVQYFCENVLDLINRQKAEIESLRKLIMDSNKEIERLEKENEVMKTNCNSMCVSMPNLAKAERTEAIKEFTERLKEKAVTQQIHYSYRDIVEVRDIDNLVKEMTGE